MIRSLLLILLSVSFQLSAQDVVIKGVAPAYADETIEIYGIEDYFSMKERLITSGTVNKDSTFSLRFNTEGTKKVLIKSKNNKGFIYVQPNSTYNVFFPDRDKFDPYRPTGNNVEVAFFELDSTDINYKILGFQRWIDNFVGNYYYRKNVTPTEFVEALDRFKGNVEKAYKEDTSSFFKTYVRFSIAGLDNIQHAAERNRYEKHDFYIKHTSVQYQNDAYMFYISDFYQNMMPRLHNETNEKVYKGVLRSSPTLIMRALGSEYTLINMRIREMIMIKSLGEVYNSGDYPQTNILTILDSVENHSLFAANAVIAKNMKARLTELVPGGKAPSFVLNGDDVKTKTLLDYRGKHIYIHFFDPNSTSNQKEIDLMIDLHERYGKYVEFVSIYKKTDSLSSEAKNKLNGITWDLYDLSASNSIWKNYQIESYSHYTLIDAAGYVVASPALKPTPNGQYETIDKTFFHLKKAWIETHSEDDEFNR